MEGGDAADDEFWAFLEDGEIAEADHDDHHVEEFAPLLFKLPGGDDAEPEQVGKGESVKIGFITACKISNTIILNIPITYCPTRRTSTFSEPMPLVSVKR